MGRPHGNMLFSVGLTWTLRCTPTALLLAFSSLGLADDTAIGRSFFEDFSTFDKGRWFVADGWTNGDHQGCVWSPKNVKATNGSLELLLTDEPAKDRLYSCAEVKTRRLFGYGTYEVRMRSAAGSGIVSAFFTYTGPPADKPHDEIDFEFLGRDRKAVQLNYFASAAGKHERVIKLAFDASAEMHDYAFEWTPDTIRWFVDGQLVHSAAKNDRESFPSHPSNIHLMIWNGVGSNMEAWLSRFQYPGHPVKATFEHVAFTEPGKPCQFPTSIVCTQTPAQAPK